MREVINHSTHIHLLNTIKSILTQTLEKLCKKRVYNKQTLITCISETLIKTSLCETEINRLHTRTRNMCIQIEKKQHMQRQVKKTYIIIYISKISTMYVNMVTRPVYKKKEVSTPPNKMKHISPLQRHVFLPLTCRILKKKPQSLHNFSPFLS